MSLWGTITAGTVGLLAGGPIGGLMGAGLGHHLDREVDGYLRAWLVKDTPRHAQRKRFLQLTAEYALAGHLSRVAGRQYEDCLNGLQAMTAQSRLSRGEQASMEALFREGRRPAFPLTEVLNQFRRTFQRRIDRCYRLLERLIFFTHFEAEPHCAVAAELRDIAARLGITARDFERFQREVMARLGKAGKPKPSMDLSAAYATLETDAKASDFEVKQAYRRQMNRHHPDKLQHQGLSAKAMAAATARTDRIRKAYDTVRGARGLGKQG